eukprot:1158756-Pelagomonas_calceolata.AAC.15
MKYDADLLQGIKDSQGAPKVISKFAYRVFTSQALALSLYSSPSSTSPSLVRELLGNGGACSVVPGPTRAGRLTSSQALLARSHPAASLLLLPAVSHASAGELPASAAYGCNLGSTNCLV